MPVRPPLTLALIGVCVIVYIAEILLGQEALLRPLLISQYYQPLLPEIRLGEWWRLVTPVFLHFSIFHIVFNMLWTWELGRAIEWRQGYMTLGILTLFIAIVSNLAQYFVSGPLFGGMSGVVYGYFGYIWIQGQINPRFGIKLNPAIVKFMLVWFVICWTGILEMLFGLSVANTAHTAGLVCGMAAAGSSWLLLRIRRPRY